MRAGPRSVARAVSVSGLSWAGTVPRDRDRYVTATVTVTVTVTVAGTGTGTGTVTVGGGECLPYALERAMVGRG